jgi:hypothetical protein
MLIAFAAGGVSLAAEKKVAAALAPSAEELLKASDRARGTAKDGVSWSVALESFDEGIDNKVDYLVKVKGDNAIAEATAPARNKGDTILFNDRNMWFFKIGNKKPISISPRQKLAGEAANGDIASTNYYRDYEGKIVGEEKIDGQDTYKLELKAKAKNVTYDGIRYWITKKERLGIKAEFLTVSGEVFKGAVIEYNNKLQDGKETYPFISKMTITSAVNPQSRSVMSYTTPKTQQLADSMFNVNNLVR